MTIPWREGIGAPSPDEESDALAGDCGPHLEKIADEVDPQALHCAFDLRAMLKRCGGDRKAVLREVSSTLLDRFRFCAPDSAKENEDLKYLRNSIAKLLSGEGFSFNYTLSNLDGKTLKVLSIASEYTKRKFPVLFLVDSGLGPERERGLGLNKRYHMLPETERRLTVWHEFGHFIAQYPAMMTADTTYKDAMKLYHDQECFGDAFMTLKHCTRGGDPEILRIVARLRSMKGFNTIMETVQEHPETNALYSKDITYRTHAVSAAAMEAVQEGKCHGMSHAQLAALAKKLVDDHAQSADMLAKTAEEMLRGHCQLRHALCHLPFANRNGGGAYLREARALGESGQYIVAAARLGEERFLDRMIKLKIVNEATPWVQEVGEATEQVLAGSYDEREKIKEKADGQSEGAASGDRFENRRSFLGRWSASLSESSISGLGLG